MAEPGTNKVSTSAGDDPRVLGLVKEYQAEWDRGTRPDRGRFLARHPDLAPVLDPYLDGLDLLHQGAKALTGTGPPPSRLDTGLSRGDRLGEYELIREVGRGGMGVVYEARQPSLNRRVAIKVLPSGLASDPTRLRRFAVEAQAAAAVAHPHIVPVYAVGEDRGVHFYVMRLVDGVSLDAVAGGVSTLTARPGGDETGSYVPAHGSAGPEERAKSAAGSDPGPTDRLVALARRDRPAYHREIVRLGSDVARALDHAHQSGVVHRDVKPANLLLDRDGHVWVTDFGLAQFTDGVTVTRSGAAVGTLRYMSPEQAAGDRRRLDHRTDVYSLGATLYELLTGRPAFPAEEPLTLLRQIAHDDPPAPRAVDPAVLADLETVLLKAMQKDPRDRYTTAAEFADDLDRFLAGRPVLARRPSAWDRAKRWAGRHPAAVAAALVSLLVVVGASALATALVAAEHTKTRNAYQGERDRADEAERRLRQAKELSGLVLRISEEEIGSDSPFQGPRRRLLLAALDNYRKLLAEDDDPEVRAGLERVERLLAEQDAAREAEAAFLLGNTDVRAELNLSAEQVARVDAVLARKWTGPGGPGRPGPGGDPRRFMFLPDPATRAELIRILTPPQRQRLRQVFLQVRGAMAFGDPEVVEALALTPAQRQQIKMIQTDGFAGFGPPGPPNGPPRGPGGPGGPRPGGPRFDPDAAARVMERILEVLTPDQRDRWRGLIGELFNPQPR